MRHILTKIAFMGSDPIALPVLNFLFEEAKSQVVLAGIFTQPDRRRGRGRQLQPNPVKQWTVQRKLPVLQPEKPREETVAWIQTQGVDLLLVMAYGHILGPAILEAPRLGAVNLHASLLPAFRGASPIAGALAAGVTMTGVTLMRMTPAMDAGPTADVERCLIPPDADAATLSTALAQASVPLMRRNLTGLITNSLQFQNQDASRATYTRKLVKADGLVDFAAPAVELERRIRALHPWPGSYFTLHETVIKIGQALADEDIHTTATHGTVLRHASDALVVAVGGGVLKLEYLQRPGGRMLPCASFLRGFTIPVGATLQGGPMKPLSAKAPLTLRTP